MKNYKLIISIIVFFLGQLLLFAFSLYFYGLIISLLSVFILFFDEIFIFIKNFIKNNLSVLLVLLILFFSFLSYFFINKNNLIAVLLFFISGLIFFIIKNNLCFYDIDKINSKKEKINKWEIFFIVFVIIATYFLYFYKLDKIPSGAIFHEARMALHFPELERKYIPYVKDNQVNWASFVFYLGLFFTKLFGYNIGNVRMASSIFSLLAAISFYFLLRRLTSSTTASLFTLLFITNESVISLSRQFYPVTILFLSILLGAYFIIEGVSRDKSFYFFISGIAAGFSLLGYLAGRVIFFILFIWLLFFIFFRKTRIKNIIFFILGFIISSMPFFYMWIKEPQVIWGYINFLDPNKNKDILQRINQFFQGIIPHIKLFYNTGDVESLLKLKGEPFFKDNYFICILFTLGFFYSVINLNKEKFIFLLLFLFLGSLPSVMSGFPFLRRASLLIPVIFLIGGMTFEHIRLIIIKNYKNHTIFIIISLLLVIFSALKSINNYFIKMIIDPSFRMTFNYSIFNQGEKIRQYKDSNIYIQPYKKGMGAEIAPVLIYPKHTEYKIIFYNHNLLIADYYKDGLFLLEPYMEASIPVIKQIFKSAQIEVIKEQNKDSKFYQSNPSPWEIHYDHFNPYCYNVIFNIKKDDIRNVRNSLINFNERELIDIYDDKFAEKYAGQKLDLCGLFILDCLNKSKLVDIKILWDGWQIYIDGKRIENERSKISLECGIHYIRLVGKVPKYISGHLPILIKNNEEDIINNKMLYAISKPYGIKIKFFKEHNGWEKKTPQFSFINFLYPFRIYKNPLPYPFSAEFTGKIQVNKDEEYSIIADPTMRTKILINDEVIYDNMKNENPYNYYLKNIKLDSNKKYDIKIQQNYNDTNIMYNTMILYYKVKTDGYYKIIPSDWITFF